MPDFCDSSDFLCNSTLLRRHSVNRTTFDPSNPVHLLSLEKFIETGNWGEVQFFCEAPYIDVPMTVLMKYASHSLSVARESEQTRQARFTARSAIREAAVI